MNQAEKHLRLGYNDQDLSQIITQSDNLKRIVTKENKVYYIFTDDSVITAKFKHKKLDPLYQVQIKFPTNFSWFTIGQNKNLTDCVVCCWYNGEQYYIHGVDKNCFEMRDAIEIAERSLESCKKKNPGYEIKVRIYNWLTEEVEKEFD